MQAASSVILSLAPSLCGFSQQAGASRSQEAGSGPGRQEELQQPSIAQLSGAESGAQCSAGGTNEIQTSGHAAAWPHIRAARLPPCGRCTLQKHQNQPPMATPLYLAPLVIWSPGCVYLSHRVTTALNALLLPLPAGLGYSVPANMSMDLLTLLADDMFFWAFNTTNLQTASGCSIAQYRGAAYNVSSFCQQVSQSADKTGLCFSWGSCLGCPFLGGVL